ncbi:putative fumarylacetoacetate (FAA) hydrolase [Mycobacterium xenopi 4042]|uniref:Putative fumarylacetoacetate (FAA) hydrolase n=1 Tax=Mycobacterium xenopi 4042 TaxID=1299334 RepID=X8AGH5_MYCXE|nr:putative fumarylacetoacetate (FAA) hydrolase [Mycobacterium xenopi 4042]
MTYRDDGGERTGVLSGEEVHAMPPGVTLLDLIERGADGLRVAGEEALRRPATVRLDEVSLAAPIPRPPSIRDCLCFLDHMRNCQQAAGGGRVLKDVWYRIPAFYFACPATVLGPYDDAPIAREALGRTSNWRSAQSSEQLARICLSSKPKTRSSAT